MSQVEDETTAEESPHRELRKKECVCWSKNRFYFRYQKAGMGAISSAP